MMSWLLQLSTLHVSSFIGSRPIVLQYLSRISLKSLRHGCGAEVGGNENRHAVKWGKPWAIFLFFFSYLGET